MTDEQSNIERLTIDEFCQKYRVKKVEISDVTGVLRQQVSNWINPVEGKGYEKQPEGGDLKKLGRYFIEHNTETGEVHIVLAQQLVKAFNLSDITGGR